MEYIHRGVLEHGSIVIEITQRKEKSGVVLKLLGQRSLN